MKAQRLPIATFALMILALSGAAPPSFAGQDVVDGEAYAIPPGDPWYQPPQVSGRRGAPADRMVFKATIEPHWYDGDLRFWYRNDLADGKKEFLSVYAPRGTRAPAFDHTRLARALSNAMGTKVEADRLPFNEFEYLEQASGASLSIEGHAGPPPIMKSRGDEKGYLRFRADGVDWTFDLRNYECVAIARESRPSTRPAPRPGRGPRPQRREGPEWPAPSDGVRSPDGKWTALVKDHNITIVSHAKKEVIDLTHDGKEELAYGRLSWSPDSRTLIGFRIQPGDRKEVHLIQSSPPSGGRARLRSRPYPLPGDRFTSYELNLFEVAQKKVIRPVVDRIDYGQPELHWDREGLHLFYEKIDRGHQRYRVIRVDPKNGEARAIIDEKTDTFIWTTHRENVPLDTITWLDQTDELIYVTERSGWRHLYLIDARTGAVKNAITSGEWVVRGIENVDEEKRQVWFQASGREPGQDPYFLHHYRVNLDGSHLVSLTPEDGDHRVQFSPNRVFLIDTYSRVNMPPVHEVRRVDDGALMGRFEQADISALEASGWKPPEVFVAKGRDGKTDIWGIICRPKNFDPSRKYPVIESIYAGPQGSFVPKSFTPVLRYSSLCDLGFIVVQIDGMGTANRSKAFHDVCWHNLKDAGFPDRILWHRAVAAKYSSYDLSRVGIYGGSAGGQNAAAGLLFHPDFYKVGVAGCGCHDNRMDKASWNEQWMGYPVGPWYAESSNIDNAYRLKGKLLLIVGEMDTNVPPESTLRLVDALVKADKDFEMLVVPNAGHGMGGPFGERRLREFFVRHLLDEKAPTRVIATAPAALADDGSELRVAIDRYEADRGLLLRSAPAPGSHERDAKLKSFHDGWLDRIKEFDFDQLGQDGRIDYLLFRNLLEHERRRLDILDRERSEWEKLVPFAGPILDLDASRRDLRRMDWGKTAGLLHDLSRKIEAARLELSSAPNGKDANVKDRAARLRSANRALAEVESLRETLQTWFGFYDGYDPIFTWWMLEPYRAVDRAVELYASALRDRFGASAAGAGREMGGRRRGGTRNSAVQNSASTRSTDRRDEEIIGTPIGREALLAELRNEMIPYTPEELISLARKELDWCEAEMKKAAREIGLGDDWHTALERVKDDHVAPGEQPAMIRDLAMEAITYLDTNNLVTIPPLCRESWRMTMMSPEAQLVNPFFLGGETIIISYPTSSMAHDAKMMSMRGNNRHFARATVHHEVIPGHHLQGFMAARHRPYRQLFRTPFLVEGWSLYWELLLWDRGFAKSPEDRMGMLFWRMHRCARIIFSLSFHLGTMTPKECIELLVNRVGHERDNATAEVRRSFNGSYGPLYQAAYLLGGMQLRALHRELVESGRMTERDFHDAVLKENAIPIEMIRASLIGQPLTADHAPSWKFAGPNP